MASLSDFTSHSQKPAISSFVSAKGPSITVRLLPENLTRAPLELACSPSPASITPAFSSSMLNFPISVRIFSSGRTPASESLLALTSTRNRIVVSFLFWVLPTRRARGGEIDGVGKAYPPAMAPRTKKGSAPSTTAAGSGASGDSWVRSRSQAKNRRNGRRCSVTWSRIVPRSIGYLASSASRMDARVTGPPISSCTSSRTCARVRRCGGRTTRITAGSGLPPTVRPGDPARWASSCLQRRPTCTPVRRGAEIHTALIERVDGHRVAQHVHVAVLLWQAFGQRLPLVSALSAAVHAQLPVGHVMLGITLDGDDVDGLRLVRVHVDHEAEVGGQVAADLVPRVAGVVRAHHVPMLLHEQHPGPRAVQRDAVHAVADLGGRIGNVLRVQTAVDRLPGLAAVVRAERARGRDRHVHPPGVRRIEQDGVEAHPAGAGLPLGSGAVAAQTGELLPRLAAVTRPEQRRVFDPGVHGVRIGERRLEVPDALELPGMLRAVVELVRGEWLAGLRRRVVDEFVALAGRHAVRRLGHPAARRLPRLAAVAGALDDLAEPPACLRRVQAVRIGGGSLDVVDLPA